MLLVGDIGGTNTRLALFEEGKEPKKLSDGRFKSKNYPGLLPIVQEFLSQQKKTISRACFGIAGPVKDDVCKATNLPWVVDIRELKRDLKLEAAFLMNDLEAQGWGIHALKRDQLYTLYQGNSGQKGNAAIIAAGTGLGEVGLLWHENEFLPFATEGGHVDFAPRNALEMEFLAYMKQSRPRISYERVLTGKGLHNLYQFLVDTGREKVLEEVREQMQTEDPAAVITAWGTTHRDPACVRTIEWFVSLYGAQAGNVALQFLTLGGLYVGGGIAPRMLDKFKEGGFLQAFLDKGRMKDLLETMPIRMILTDEAALYGAAQFSYRQQKLGRG